MNSEELLISFYRNIEVLFKSLPPVAKFLSFTSCGKVSVFLSLYIFLGGGIEVDWVNNN